MGLDGVELVIATEQAFGITFSQHDLVHCETPRHVIDAVFSKLSATQAQTCPSQRAFHLVRKALQTILSAERQSIRLDTPLRELVPRRRQHLYWKQLQTAIRARTWPDPSRPFWLRRLLLGLLIGVFVGTGGMLRWYAPAYSWLWTLCLSLLSAGSVGCGLIWLTRPLKRCLPFFTRVVRDLIPFALTSDDLAWTREHVARMMKRLIIDQLGLDNIMQLKFCKFLKKNDSRETFP